MKAAELRQSILQAAVQGKLVPQYTHDEPASELLKRIQQEKAQLVKEGKIKKEKLLPPIAEDEIPYDLPDGWVWCRLNEIFDFVDYRGKTPNKTNSGIPLITAANIKKGYMDYKKQWYISEKEFETRKSRGLSGKGDILFTTEAPLGNVALADLDTFSAGQRIITFKKYLSQQNNQLYVFFLLSPDIQERIFSKRSGMTATGIKAALLKLILVPLPPLAEQQRIAAKVDELMALCDELEAAESELDKLDANFAEYLPKSVLQAAVQGKLVPQNIHDEPASELLKRIQREKARLVKEGKIKKEKPLPPIAEDEIPYDLPDGWVWCRIRDVCVVNPRNQLTDDVNVAFVPMALISSEYFGGHKQEKRLWKDVKNGFTHFAENDVAIAKITPCFQNAKSCVMRKLENGYGAGTTELHILRCVEILPEYLLAFVKSPMFLLDGERNMTGTAGQQRVPTDYIANNRFPLPPLAEQSRIVAKVDELMALCDELKAAKVFDGKPATSNIVPFPQQDEDEELLMVAQGEVSGKLSNELKQAQEDLFGDGADE